jgi:hypothetical protein
MIEPQEICHFLAVSKTLIYVLIELADSLKFSLVEYITEKYLISIS